MGVGNGMSDTGGSPRKVLIIGSGFGGLRCARELSKSRDVHVTLIEPGSFATDWSGSSATRSAPLPDYDEVHAATELVRAKRISAPGDPTASASAILKVVDAVNPPLRVFFGDLPLTLAKADYESRLTTWEEWQPVAVEAQG